MRVHISSLGTTEVLHFYDSIIGSPVAARPLPAVVQCNSLCNPSDVPSFSQQRIEADLDILLRFAFPRIKAE